jgi:AcrR family transcriptional regulator
VDGIAKAAGVTSGAFYAHFPSKAAAFREAVAAGMADLRQGIAALQEKAGAKWRAAFVDFYLGERRTCDISESCALQALSGDISRGNVETRTDYEVELRRIVDLMSEDLEGLDRSRGRSEAIALLAILAGGVSMARAVNDPVFSEEIAEAVRAATGRISGENAE